MNILLELILLGVGFLSLVPVIHLFNTSKDMKYRCLKFLVNATFVWTILIFIERISANMNIVYYAHMLGYPLKFLMSSFMLCTIYNYIEKKLPKSFIIILGIVFLIEYVIAITNAQSQLLVELVPGQVLTFDNLYTATKGTFFIVHLLLTYGVLLSSIIYLTAFLRTKRNIRHYKSVSKTMVYSVILVLSFNTLQLLVLQSNIDLTYISLVIVTFMLYQVIYRKDMIFNLKTSGRGEILSNMREMYILTDYDKRVVEISKLLEEKYHINTTSYEGKPFDLLLEDLKKSIVVYENYEVDELTDEEGKDHYHLREKRFSLNHMNEYGYMILMYDETQVFSLLRDLNKLSNYDNMTGLHNRNYIESKLSKYEDTTNVGILSLDLNGLKANNDYLGHERGDYLLKQLANKMKTVMSSHQNSEMARIGGDEFMIILKDTNSHTLEEIKKQILQLCDNQLILEKISVSIGIAFGNDENINIYELIQKADADMYQMKQITSKDYSKEIVLYATNNVQYIR
ncbi:MAG: diguanylate cyclase [Bacilli bacterium]|nr:diguanylate cyclase [Bacilli bacterium]